MKYPCFAVFGLNEVSWNEKNHNIQGDKSAPYPIFIDWAITNQCNLSCTHCRYNIKSKIELNNTEAIKLAQEISELKSEWVLIEGGEPFLRKDLFLILAQLKSALRPIYIISSGNHFNKNYAEMCQNINVRLMISLDSANKDTYQKIRKGGSYKKVMQTIETSQDFNILDSINFTLQELNGQSQEIKAIGQLTNELKIKGINFLGYKPNKQSSGFSNLSTLFSEIVNVQEKYGIKVMVDEPFFKPWLIKSKIKKQKSKTIDTGPIVAESKSGCIFSEYLFIEPDGTFKPCSFSLLSFDQMGMELIRKIKDKRNRKGKCGKCEYQLECGGCRVRTYVLTGDWFESDPFCPL